MLYHYSLQQSTLYFQLTPRLLSWTRPHLTLPLSPMNLHWIQTRRLTQPVKKVFNCHYNTTITSVTEVVAAWNVQMLDDQIMSAMEQNAYFIQIFPVIDKVIDIECKINGNSTTSIRTVSINFDHYNYFPGEQIPNAYLLRRSDS